MTLFRLARYGCASRSLSARPVLARRSLATAKETITKLEQVTGPAKAKADTSRRKTNFPGAANSYFTPDLVLTKAMEPVATYQVMDTDGMVADPRHEPGVSEELAVGIYRDMVTVRSMDKVLYEAQRQGRISFYLTGYGEEAIVGSAAALNPRDVMFGQYREAGALVHRGFTLNQIMDQCFGNHRDLSHGRQMPVHYGSRDLHFVTISSPLATQIPQAAGAAYALKRQGEGRCVMCYFGDGAASEGDFHAALNMATTLECPVIFFCRNNGFAISTPAAEQYRGDGVASRGIGYGMDTIRCDGNDVWAVYNATRKARALAVEQNRPVLIEALTYRVSHHSTSDDSSAYRSAKEVEEWQRRDNPVTRLRKWLEHRGWWDADREAAATAEIKDAIMAAFRRAESTTLPPVEMAFTDVYAAPEMSPALQAQKREVEALLKKYPEYYKVDDFAKPE
ncbi:hypothetical protein IWQ60_003125 [Tieghemiomyces parasiticus]|uniref:2-oxoisovalerate dehydrogenase subunit alpha n=1 Tax=Tieghemiomyces parasiticus TaxID=78921 RepID=A0A9W8E0Z5_9FUNG|nr:hypothetical protein IWQ60_003125 [Tieghemiomyces parasiticus]